MANDDIWEATLGLRFVPRLEGDRLIRVLQQLWRCTAGPSFDSQDWRDVPYVDGD